ncbi:MAG: peptidylprolyl isomerase, partial [Actinobacteria bacterium]|nr:peptidylprolyl isomerase [Actinomycetota bacterium]
MPTNAQRRETAQRKLERQLQRRAQRAKRQRILTVVGAMTALAVGAALIAAFVLTNDKGASTASTSSSAETTSTEAATPAARGGEGQLPVFKAAADLGANCQYPAAQKASKKVDAPNSGKVPTDPATISVSMSTDQ